MESPGFVTTLQAVAPDRFGRASEWKLSVSPDGTVTSGTAYAVPKWTSDEALAGCIDDFQSLSISCKYRVVGPLDVSSCIVLDSGVDGIEPLLIRFSGVCRQ